MASFPVAIGALGINMEPCSSQNATALSRSFAVYAFSHATSAARTASATLPLVRPCAALALTTRCCDLILIPPFATAFSFIGAGVYHFLSPLRLPSGETPDRRISQHGHTVWRIQDGAIPPPTNIAQTTDGFLWVTTAQGLMRFDGVRFMPWQPPQGQNLPGTHFSAVLGSRDGSLWIGTTRGLARSKTVLTLKTSPAGMRGNVDTV